jgi:mono/diheme cytochrome c family protein
MLLLASCAIGDDGGGGKLDEALVLGATTPLAAEGVLEFGTTVFAESPTTLLEAGDLHGYELHGKAGGIVTITMTAQTCSQLDPIVHLFGPEDASGDRGEDLASNDDTLRAPCGTNAQIERFTLPVDGEYLIVATSFRQRGGGHYALTLTCDNGACTPSDAMTFARSRIAQADIDNTTLRAGALFDIGDFLFEHVFSLDEGLGNALVGAPAGNAPRPNFRSVHQGGFGAPEAQSCITCHNVGGDDGAGDLDHNIFQVGDGSSRASGLARNPPVVLGLGLRQQIGMEMTSELTTKVASARLDAQSRNLPVTVALTTKGVSFGALVVRPDGSTDTSGVQGIDADLVVKPFGWKGREATLRRFVEGGFRVHFGMQSAPSIAKHCATPDPSTFGTGASCRDPDADGVADEITEGQLSAMAVYMALREMPVRVQPESESARARASAGENLFGSIGCGSCHVRSLRMAQPFTREVPDTSSTGIVLDLSRDMKEPRPARNSDGSMTVELWSDFKRHDMGSALADSKPFKTIPASHFITTPLWGVATSPPYMHDGRSPTLRDAILAHAGESQGSRAAFAALGLDDQQKVVDFLATLGRE